MRLMTPKKKKKKKNVFKVSLARVAVLLICFPNTYAYAWGRLAMRTDRKDRTIHIDGVLDHRRL